MECQAHPSKKVSYKCISCVKFLCNQCSRSHQAQRHDVITVLELADIIKVRITQEIGKMNNKISDLCHLKDFQAGETVIYGCMEEILGFIKHLFDQIKTQYRKIVDESWKMQNLEVIREIQNKKSILEQWRQMIIKKSEQAAHFDVQKIYTLNKIQSDEELIDSSQSYMISNMSPKINFNEVALRRANQSLTKIIFTQTKFKSLNRRKIIKITSKKSLKQINNLKYIGMCKFIEGSNIMLQYVIQDPQGSQNYPILTKTQFRQFVSPMRSTSLNSGNSIYLVGGYNKENRARKQIYLLERSFTTMRIVGLLKQGRVGHAVCAHEDDIYIFGGKAALSLEQFNTKTKSVEVVGRLKSQIIGATMVALGSKLYMLGGTDGVEPNKKVFCYDTAQKILKQITPMNADIYMMPISPILQCLSENQILIFGGYFTYSGQSYNNSYMILFDCRMNFMSVFGKGQLIYPLVANGSNSILKDGTIISLADLKRQRHKHGPNLPAIFTFNLGEESMQLDSIGL